MWLALKVVVFTVVVPGTVTVWLPYLMVTRRGQMAQLDPWGYLAAVGIVLGAAVYLRCAWDFAVSGHGTPAPIDAPRKLVVRGLYRFVRNPMYLGVLTVLMCEAALFRSLALLAYAGCFTVGFHLFVLLYEEPTLRKKFGEEYEAYLRAVPRWLPRLRG